MEKQFYSKIVGVTGDNEDGRNRQALIRKFVSREEVLILEREPDNPNDPDAIAAYIVPLDDPWDEGQYKIGYLTSEVAFELAPLIDRGYQVVCQVSNVTGGVENRESLGVNVLLTVFTPEEVAERRRQREAQNAAKKPPEFVMPSMTKITPKKATSRKPRSIWFYGLIAGVIIGALASIGHILNNGAQDLILNFLTNVIVYTLFATAGIALLRKLIKF